MEYEQQEILETTEALQNDKSEQNIKIKRHNPEQKRKVKLKTTVPIRGFLMVGLCIY